MHPLTKLRVIHLFHARSLAAWSWEVDLKYSSQLWLKRFISLDWEEKILYTENRTEVLKIDASHFGDKKKFNSIAKEDITKSGIFYP